MTARTRRYFSLLNLLLFFGTCHLPALKAQAGQPLVTQEKPLWSASPEKLAYNLTWNHAPYLRVGNDVVRIQFLDSQRLSLAWTTPDEPLKKSDRYPINVPSHLHLSILDAKTGQRVSDHEWPCMSRGVNLAYTASARWLLFSNESLSLYSSSFEKIKELQHIKMGLSPRFVSQDGRTLLASVLGPGNVWTPQLLDSDTFEVIDSWNDTRFTGGYFAYSDRFILAQITKEHRLFIREIGKDWIPYALGGDASQPVSSYTFVNNDTVAIVRGNQLVVSNVSGPELFKESVPQAGLLFPLGWQTAATSAGGERFAVILDRMRGINSPPLDLYSFRADDRVMVYSVPDGAAIFSVKVIGSSPWFSQYHWNSVAVSPDGSLLGIASDDGVRVYILPSTQTRP